MPLYRYLAYNRKGKLEKGFITAPGVPNARKMLKKKGLYVKTLQVDTEKKDRELFPVLSKWMYRVPRRDVGNFSRQLGTLLDAGLPLDRSLDNILEQTENIYLQKAIGEIRAAVVEGEALSDAIRKHPAIFPPIYHNLISVGEKTGTYEKSLLRLADLEEASQKLKNSVMTAMLYPLFMTLLLAAIIIFLLAVVFPQIQELFVQMDQKLPLVTRLVIWVSDIMSSWKIIFPLLLGGTGYYLFHSWKSEPAGQEKYEDFLLKIPFIGMLIRKVLLARFSQNLGVLLQSRVPLLTSLQVVARLVNHLIFEKEINRAIERIKEGSRITDAFSDSRIITSMVLGMISAGELSDTIPDMVMKVASILDSDVDAALQRLSSLMEPIMMVVMGLVIVIIMVAILLPMYNLTGQLQ